MNVKAEERDPRTYAIIGAAMEIHCGLKALSRLSSVEEAQLLNYLKATGLKRGLLLNFEAQSLQY